MAACPCANSSAPDRLVRSGQTAPVGFVEDGRLGRWRRFPTRPGVTPQVHVLEGRLPGLAKALEHGGEPRGRQQEQPSAKTEGVGGQLPAPRPEDPKQPLPFARCEDVPAGTAEELPEQPEVMLQAQTRAQGLEARSPRGHGGRRSGLERGHLVGQALDATAPAVAGGGAGARLRTGQPATGQPAAGTESGLEHRPIPSQGAAGLELPKQPGEPVPEPTDPPTPPHPVDVTRELPTQPAGQAIPRACRQAPVPRAGGHEGQAAQSHLRIPDFGQPAGAPLHDPQPTAEVRPAHRRTDPFQQRLQPLEVPSHLMDRIPVGGAFQPVAGKMHPLNDQAVDGVDRGLPGAEAIRHPRSMGSAGPMVASGNPPADPREGCRPPPGAPLSDAACLDDARPTPAQGHRPPPGPSTPVQG